MNRQTITKDTAPSLIELGSEYCKISPIKAVRMNVPFTVVTREGALSCGDGYLAVDSKGYPYPIEKDEFERTYSPVESPAALVWFAVRQVIVECVKAREIHSPMRTPHEAYAVILEELDEFWEEVRAKTHNKGRMRKELIQVAAMSVLT